MRSRGAIGNPMLVKLPIIGEGWEDTGEGGLAFFLCVRQKSEYNEKRQVCIAGEIFWPKQDVCLNRKYDVDNDDGLLPIDAGLLIGSTGYSLYSNFRGGYFQPTYEDLTPLGQKLYKLLKQIYGDIDIVTLLDT